MTMTAKDKFVLLVQTNALGMSKGDASSGFIAMQKVYAALTVREEKVPEDFWLAAQDFMHWANRRFSSTSISDYDATGVMPEWMK
jgi:DNA-binding transcriptional regulator GbsR (MarR family)